MEMDTPPQATEDIRCDKIIGHVDNCKLCKSYLRSEIKFQYFIIIILSVFIIFKLVHDSEKERKN